MQAFAGFSEDLALQSKANVFDGLAPVAVRGPRDELVAACILGLGCADCVGSA